MDLTLLTTSAASRAFRPAVHDPAGPGTEHLPYQDIGSPRTDLVAPGGTTVQPHIQVEGLQHGHFDPAGRGSDLPSGLPAQAAPRERLRGEVAPPLGASSPRPPIRGPLPLGSKQPCQVRPPEQPPERLDAKISAMTNTRRVRSHRPDRASRPTLPRAVLQAPKGGDPSPRRTPDSAVGPRGRSPPQWAQWASRALHRPGMNKRGSPSMVRGRSVPSSFDS